MGVKPTPTHISRYATKDEVIYRCSKCGESFRFYGYKETTCRHCGEEIDWGVIVRVNDFVRDIYHNGVGDNTPLFKIQKAIVEYLTEFNESGGFVKTCYFATWPNDVKDEFRDAVMKKAKINKRVFSRA